MVLRAQPPSFPESPRKNIVELVSFYLGGCGYCSPTAPLRGKHPKIMKNTYSKEELQAKANEVFSSFENAKKVYATLDGNVFIEENRARLHAGTKGTIVPFDRPIDQDSDDIKLSAPERIKLIQEVTSLEALEAFKNETAKTVKAAYEAKLQELSNPAN